MELGRTVSELEASMSSSEFTQWMAFYNVQPFGPERDNVHAGIVASTVANANRGKSQRPFAVSDFVLKPKDPEPANPFGNLVAFLNAHAVDKKP